MLLKHVNIITIQVFLIIFYFAEATLTPKSPKSKEAKPKVDKIKLGPTNHSVFTRKLVVENPTSKDILNNHEAYYENTNENRIEGLVLGYVTPWNNHGYDVAKIFANKFTHISPVWLQIKRRGKLKYEVTGTHDVDKNWMADVKKAGQESKVKIVPRILFDGWSAQDYKSILSSDEETSALTQSFVTTCKKWKFDGLVLEVWSQVAGSLNQDLLVGLVKKIATSLTDEKLDFILVIPPKKSEEYNLFTPQHFNDLYDYVTGFSLMTYDFSSLQRPGPNSPVKWIEDCVKYLTEDLGKRDKILTGFNFYGNVYTPNGGGPIVAHEYLKLLKFFKGKLLFDPASGENYFEAKTPEGHQYVFYPTLYSISKRLDLVSELGVGVSIWEIGQGLDYFYDLF